MKRILSLIMSVLMIATMFCGFAVTADDSPFTGEGNPFDVTLIPSEVAEDGTFTVEIWVKDNNTTYGFEQLGFTVYWDEDKIAPNTTVVKDSTTSKNVPAFIEISGMNSYVDWVYSQKGALFTQATIVSAYSSLKTTKPPIKVLGYYATGAEPYNYISVGFGGDADNSYPLTFNQDYIEAWGADSSGLALDAEKGIMWGTASFKVLEGASGDAKVWVIPDTVQLRKDDYISLYTTPTGTGVTCTPAVIDCGSDEPEVPALPEGITLDVAAEVSARTADPAGLRFVSTATATDWTNVSEMGTAIVKAGTKPGVDTTLVVPARVDYDGDYLQAYTKTEDGLYDFEAGITTEKASVTYTGVLSNIKDANKDAEFTAYAYIIVDGVTYYSENSATASYNEIFGAAEADPSLQD